MEKGTLFVVSLPIGNLKDITLRAIEILKKVKIIVCEDTRSFQKLNNYFNFGKKELLSFYKGVEGKRVDALIEILLKGEDVALVSEAGTPLISDPGAVFIRLAYKNNIKIVPIPGASALCTAISVSGFSPKHGFLFLGFLPKKEKEAKDLLKNITDDMAVVIFESPNRIKKTLKLLIDELGNRKCVLARELTKLHEEIYLTDLLSLSKKEEFKGEITLVIGPLEKEKDFPDSKDTKTVSDLSISEIVKFIKEKSENLRKQGISNKEIAKILSKEIELKPKEIYEILLLLDLKTG